MSKLTASDLAAKADLVQLSSGSLWALTKAGCLMVDFPRGLTGAAVQKAQLETLLPFITAWRENGHGGSTFGRWHNLADEEVAA